MLHILYKPFFIKGDHFTQGNQDWLGENDIPSTVRDNNFPKRVKI